MGEIFLSMAMVALLAMVAFIAFVVDNHLTDILNELRKTPPTGDRDGND